MQKLYVLCKETEFFRITDMTFWLRSVMPWYIRIVRSPTTDLMTRLWLPSVVEIARTATVCSRWLWDSLNPHWEYIVIVMIYLKTVIALSVETCFCQNGANFLRRLALQEKKNLIAASRCCWNRARRLTCFLSSSVTRKDLQFGTWTDTSFQRHYRFRPTTSGSRSG